MYVRPRLLLQELVLLGGLLLLAGCSLFDHFDEAPPLSPSQWSDFSGEWRFTAIEPIPIRALRIFALEVAICQNGPELVGYGGDTNLNGLVRLDGSFEFFASFLISGISIKWIIWGDLKSGQFQGYYKPEESELFYVVKFEGHRLGPVRGQDQGGLGCPEGFRGEADHQKSRLTHLLGFSGIFTSPTDDVQPLDPAQWPAMAGEWQFSVIDPLALKSRKFSIPICQLGPELRGAFVDDMFLSGIPHLDGKFALIVRQYVGQKMSVWTIWGDLTKTELEGYYKPWDSSSFYVVKLEGRRVGPVRERCPQGFRGQ